MYEVKRNPWDKTYMMSLMNILTFATRLIKDDKLDVRRTFEKVQDRGSWYPMILDGYYLSLQYIMFQCIEYGRQREYDAPRE